MNSIKEKRINIVVLTSATTIAWLRIKMKMRHPKNNHMMELCNYIVHRFTELKMSFPSIDAIGIFMTICIIKFIYRILFVKISRMKEAYK